MADVIQVEAVLPLGVAAIQYTFREIEDVPVLNRGAGHAAIETLNNLKIEYRQWGGQANEESLVVACTLPKLKTARPCQNCPLRASLDNLVCPYTVKQQQLSGKQYQVQIKPN